MNQPRIDGPGVEGSGAAWQAGEVSTYTCVNCLKLKHSMTDKPNLYGQCSECRANGVPVPPLPPTADAGLRGEGEKSDDGPNMAWPAAPMSAPSSDVLDPSPSLASTGAGDRASNEISGGMGGLIESARLAPPLPTAAQERAAAGLRGEAEAALKAEARQVARTLVVTSGKDYIGIGSYEPGIATIVQLDADGVKRRARTAESWVAYIADALYKFATRPRPAPQPATATVREEANRFAARVRLTSSNSASAWRAEISNGFMAGHAFAYQHAQPATGEGPFSSDEALARLFHDTYERLAPSFGYETRPETRTFDPASKNGRLMLAVMREVRTVLAAKDRPAARSGEEVRRGE